MELALQQCFQARLVCRAWRDRAGAVVPQRPTEAVRSMARYLWCRSLGPLPRDSLLIAHAVRSGALDVAEAVATRLPPEWDYGVRRTLRAARTRADGAGLAPTGPSKWLELTFHWSVVRCDNARWLLEVDPPKTAVFCDDRPAPLPAPIVRGHPVHLRRHDTAITRVRFRVEPGPEFAAGGTHVVGDVWYDARGVHDIDRALERITRGL